jgi:peptidoglycan/LPS O-acetylase OafA/YrhL
MSAPASSADSPAAPSAAAPRAGGKHIPVLDGIRGVAILMVMVFHLMPGIDHPGRAWTAVGHAVGFGQTGVDLFFVLSGFLITGILLDAKNEPRFFRNFYARRILRIFPLYYGVLIVLFLVGAHLSGEQPRLPAGSGQLWFWFYASNFHYPAGAVAIGHFWSLAIEEQFYLVWPTVVWLCTPRQLRWVCVAAMAEAFISRWYMARYVNPEHAFYFTFCRIDSLAAGALLANLIREPWGMSLLRRWSLPTMLAAAAVTGASWLAISKGEHGWGLIVKHTLLSVFFGSVIAASVVESSGLLTGCLSARWLRLLGKYSYGLYVYHGIFAASFDRLYPTETLIAGLHSPQLGATAHMVLGMATTLGIAMLSWHLYEKQFLKLKRYFEYRPASTRSDSAARMSAVAAN